MRNVFRAFQPVGARIGGTAATIARSSNRSLWLGLAVVAATSASIYATTNTPPHITSFTVDKASIDEGQSVTVTGTFTDPDAADLHSVHINWYDGNKQVLQLPAGQYSFSATHKYTDNRASHLTWIYAAVIDKDAAPQPNDNADVNNHVDTKTVPSVVNNVAPTFSHNLTVEKNVRGKPGAVVIEGDLADPGTADTLKVLAKWGDNSGPVLSLGEECKIERSKHFTCSHIFPTSPARGYTVELTAKDDDGGQTKKSVNVQIP
jgi:hypothetical protein